MWQPQLAALADEFTVVAWDEPGAGRSSDVPADFGLADYANCLAALIEALALGPPSLGRASGACQAAASAASRWRASTSAAPRISKRDVHRAGSDPTAATRLEIVCETGHFLPGSARIAANPRVSPHFARNGAR
jgi:pimeloyl-ACP methyl ester carboxylesterase